jgi:three-Cys-motif partner protein
MIDDDGFPMSEVGPWAKEKHARLRRYIEITAATRRKFVVPTPARPRVGGATYIDLYCGPGRSVVGETGEVIEGSPLVAFNAATDVGVPFSQVYLVDANEEWSAAVKERLLRRGADPIVEVGTAEQTIGRIVRQLNPYGLHFAFLDPFNLSDLPFSVIETLSKLKYIDILIHVSVQDLQRNWDRYASVEGGTLDRFAPGWRKSVNVEQSQTAARAAYVGYWADQIQALGFRRPGRPELVTGSRNQRLYWLMFAGNEFAVGLWEKIRNISRQTELPF